MKKSIFWRCVLVALILIGWGVSIFPYKDRDFRTVWEAEVKAHHKEEADMARHEKLLVDAEAEVAKTKAELAAGNVAYTGPRTLADAIIIVANRDQIALTDYIELRNAGNASASDIVNYVRKRALGRIRLGTDLRGGTEIVVAFDPDDIKSGEAPEAVRDRIMEVLRKRVDETGTLGAELRPTGDSRISILIPATDPADIARFITILERPAILEFYKVHPQHDTVIQAYVTNGDIPDGYKVIEESASRDGFKTRVPLIVESLPIGIEGRHVDTADFSIDPNGRYVVNLSFDSEGAAIFGQVTSAMIGERLAIVLDGVSRSSPTIQAALFSTCQISGSFTREEAADLATVLKSGDLPVQIKVEGVNTTQPTLGLATIKAGIYAGLGGMLVVILFMLVYYRISGSIAVVALLANALLILGSMPIIDASLTLPGIAGMILTIGMAVDANVLIFERIREEQDTGKNIMTAVKNGYDKVFSTILDANLTTLITAFFLYKFGSGPIKGFAVTLSIGIVASMFTALFVTRLIFDMLLEWNLIKRAGMMQFFKQPSFKFMRKARVAMAISGLLIIGSILVLALKGSNAFAVDFTGGLQLQYTYAEKINTHDIVTTLKESGHPVSSATYKGTGDDASILEILVRDVNVEDEAGASENSTLVLQVQDALNAKYPAAKVSAGQATMIGALVGKAFQSQALKAIGLSLLAMILYISFRFEFAYALGAVACLVHDVLITTGVFLAMGHREISLNVIAALLTIIGYSLNDTIVVYDRIRENVGLDEKMKFRDTVNLSINQTLSRTLLTSLTTLFTVVTLYIFGGGAINDFALIMLIGIIAGTYSTIFIATPIMMWWHNYRATARAEAKANEKNVSSDSKATA